jgi:hypothetical protein
VLGRYCDPLFAKYELGIALKSGLPKAAMGWDGLGWNSLGVCIMAVFSFVAVRIGFGEIDGSSWVQLFSFCWCQGEDMHSSLVQRSLGVRSTSAHFSFRGTSF